MRYNDIKRDHALTVLLKILHREPNQVYSCHLVFVNGSKVSRHSASLTIEPAATDSKFSPFTCTTYLRAYVCFMTVASLTDIV